MSQRNVRVNELLKREISRVLHTRYQAETVQITIIRTEVSPDHRKAHVFFSVLEADEAPAARRWLTRHQRDIRQQVGKQITLKFLPHLQFHYDPSIAQGDQLLGLLDELDEESNP